MKAVLPTSESLANKNGLIIPVTSPHHNNNLDPAAPIALKIEDAAFTNHQAPTTANRGLSKSMIIPTPVSDFNNDDDYDDEIGIDNGKIINIVGAEPSSCSCVNWIRRYLDLSLLHDPLFILMCLSVVLMSTGCPYMLYYLPAYVLTAGYTKTEAGYLVAVSAALDLIGRLCKLFAV